MSHAQLTTRTAGVLLHPTSLPGPYGIGDLGPAAYDWVDKLVEAKQTWWQILPLGPTGFADSPYQSFSAFAGNPLLVSPDFLIEEGLIDAVEIAGASFPNERVAFAAVIPFKDRLFNRAWENFQKGRGTRLKGAYERFVSESQAWLRDYALFMAIRNAQGGKSWQEWPRELRVRDPQALAAAAKELAGAVGLQQFRQFLFFEQWRRIREYAASKRIKIIGDIPIFVAGDSADVWSNPHLFQLDKECRPKVVAGVPPDYFSQTGQLWGNPLYDWQAMAKTDFAWWIARFQALFKLVDVVRLDHFRGFDAYWEVPAGKPNAIQGRWVQAPGEKLLRKLQQVEPGKLPIIAEDLGVITPEVEALRDGFGLPGMRVLQFGFGEKPTNPYLPHNYVQNSVAYTGTHDNDTSRGWYESVGDWERDHVRRYLARDGSDVAWDFIRAVWKSVSETAVTPLQDMLSLGSEARMNSPGKASGNWGWRFQAWQVNSGLLARLADLTELYGRVPQPKPAPAHQIVVEAH